MCHCAQWTPVTMCHCVSVLCGLPLFISFYFRAVCHPLSRYNFHRLSRSPLCLSVCPSSHPSSPDVLCALTVSWLYAVLRFTYTVSWQKVRQWTVSVLIQRVSRSQTLSTLTSWRHNRWPLATASSRWTAHIVLFVRQPVEVFRWLHTYPALPHPNMSHLPVMC